MFQVRVRDVPTLKIRAPDLVESYENELLQKSHKGAFCCKPLYQPRFQVSDLTGGGKMRDLGTRLPLYKTSDLEICQQSIKSDIFLAMT